MATLTDARFDALRGQGFTGAISDMLLQWLQANGATANAVPDAWNEFLTGAGFSGQRNTAWYEYLGSLGYTGALNDRELQFWDAGGVVSPDGVRITQQPVRYQGLEGSTATFTVVATSGNASPLTYQWQERIDGVWGNVTDGGTVSGATTATLTITTISVLDNGRLFRCRVSNSYNSVNSQFAAIQLTGAKWFIIDQLGNRMIDEPAVDTIMDERTV